VGGLDADYRPGQRSLIDKVEERISAVDKDIVGSQVSMIDLTAGPIDYLDIGGDGPTVVLLHGVLMKHVSGTT
jgi:hypothetical protein